MMLVRLVAQRKATCDHRRAIWHYCSRGKRFSESPLASVEFGGKGYKGSNGPTNVHYPSESAVSTEKA
jgi:hypothetical protein